MAEQNEFKVPREVIEQMGSPAPGQEANEGLTASHFTIPDQAVRDLGKIAGDASDADQLLADTPPQDDAPPPTPPQDEWITERNRRLASRNFSFVGGETSALFEELKPRHQNKVRDLARKLIEQYASRGVTAHAIGLTKDNDVQRYLRRHGGAVMGDAYDEYYLVCMGMPLENRSAGSKRESDRTYVRRRGIKYAVRNFMDMEVGRDFAFPRNMIPRLDDNEWLPAILAVEVIEKW